MTSISLYHNFYSFIRDQRKNRKVEFLKFSSEKLGTLPGKLKVGEARGRTPTSSYRPGYESVRLGPTPWNQPGPVEGSMSKEREQEDRGDNKGQVY